MARATQKITHKTISFTQDHLDFVKKVQKEMFGENTKNTRSLAVRYIINKYKLQNA